MSVLADTNVLLRRTQPGHAAHEAAVESIARLLEAGETVCFTFQNVSEFVNVATRPVAGNGLGFPLEMALAEIAKIERSLTLLPDVPAIYAEWKRLVARHRVHGVKVHDAKLAAAMRVHGVSGVLTFNTADFARYGVEAIDPGGFAEWGRVAGGGPADRR